MALKKIHVIGTGGTISQITDPDSGTKIPVQSVKQIFGMFPEFSCEYRLSFSDVCIIDSSDMSPAIWAEIGSELVEKLRDPEINGILITHGTDTMAWTAMYFYLSLKNINKPVVLTGSQKTVGEEGSDVFNNLDAALFTAANSCFREPVVVFCDKVFDAPNLRKVKIWDLDPYRKINGEPIAYLQRDGKRVSEIRYSNFELLQKRYNFIDSVMSEYYSSINTPKQNRSSTSHIERKISPFFDYDFTQKVEIISVWPGISYKIINKFLALLDGAVVVGFGAGNAHRRLKPLFEDVTIPVVFCSSGEGELDMLEYGSGKRFSDLVVPSGDWIPEYSSMRLSYILGHEEIASFNRKKIYEIFLQGARIKSKEKYEEETSIKVGEWDMLFSLPFEVMLHRLSL
ncbi:MAG: asparaginase [Thermoplasmata archaeon]